MLTKHLFTKTLNARNLILPSISIKNNLQIPNNAVRTKKCYSFFEPAVRQLACRFCSSGSGTAAAVGVPDKTTSTDDNGILKRVLKKVGFVPNSKVRIRVSSHILYESVADKINYLRFFNDFKLPNTFNSWFLVTELHVWMLLLRAMAEGSESGQDGRFLRNCIVEAMWGDVNTRAKKLGGCSSSRIRQQIAELSEQFQAALITYDEGIMSDDRVLAAALWRRFFEMNCEEYESIERLVDYVRKQVQMLDNLSRQDFLVKPKIPWEVKPKIPYEDMVGSNI